MFRGELLENRIVVWNIDEARRLYASGFYGKPLGVPKPKGADFDAPLILDLMEGYYLAEKGRLKVFESNRPISLRRLKAICRKEYVDFDVKYLVYKTLRDSGLVVTPGIKFGSDFAVYKKGPGLEHAPFIIQVFRSSDKLTATQVVLSGRLATTVRKRFVMAIVSRRGIDFFGFEWWKP